MHVDYLFCFNAAQMSGEKECKGASRTIGRWRKVIASRRIFDPGIRPVTRPSTGGVVIAPTSTATS